MDRAARNGQDGQTKGIPIGPDTSLVLAETILCAIDRELIDNYPKVAERGLRFVDDFEFYANSRAEAESVLMLWDSILSSYDLQPNPTKTHIFQGPPDPEFLWRSQLSQFRIRRTSDETCRSDLYSFFTLAISLARINPSESVLTYAIRRVNPIPIEPKSWRAFSDLLLTCAVAEPSSLSTVFEILQKARSERLPLDVDKLNTTVNDLCIYHAPLEHGSEVAWSLQIVSTFGLTLDSTAAAKVSFMQDNCSLLLLVHLDKVGRVTGDRPDLRAIFSRAEDADAHNSRDWLLAYECGRLGWSNDANIKAQPHWAELRHAGVVFFAPTTPTPTTPTPTTPTPTTPTPTPTPTTPTDIVWVPDDGQNKDATSARFALWTDEDDENDDYADDREYDE